MKVLFLILGLLGFGFVHAQYRTGTTLIDATSSLKSRDAFDDFYFKGGVFALDGLLVGLVVRADNGRLFNTYSDNISARGDLFVRYFPSRSSRLNPYVELGVGTLTDAKNFLAVRPAVGVQYQFSPGVYGRAAVSYEYSTLGEAYTLEVGSAVSLSDWSNKDRIPVRLQTGNLVVNSHLASISWIENQEYPGGLYGSVRLQGDFMLGASILLGGDATLLRTTRYYMPLALPTDFTSVQLSVEAKYRVPLRINFVDPYGGLGVAYAGTQQQPERNGFTSSLTVRESGTVSPYLEVGSYFHVTERIILNASYDRFLDRLSELQGKNRVEIGLALRLGDST